MDLVRLSQRRYGVGAFLALFTGAYIVAEALYALIPPHFLVSAVYPSVLARPAAAVINWFAAEPVKAVDFHLIGPRVQLDVVRGCDGSGILLMLASAILAYPASLRSKGYGLAASIGVVYVLNELRLIAVYGVVRVHPEWLVPVHTYLLPTLLVVACGLWFLGWVDYATKH